MPLLTTRRALYSGAMLCGATALLIGAATELAPRALKEPPAMAQTRGPLRGADVKVKLDIKYGDNKIYNPATGLYDDVHLRSYNGALVGPTIRVRPGDELDVDFENNLPENDPSCSMTMPDHNTPNCFNSSNLHTHGFHVSPSGNSDNVLLDFPPTSKFGYVFNLPKDHPAGTFWYHSHRHGSTALQVSSGMVGALIVEGNRPLAEKARNGAADIDTILKHVNGKPFDDHIMLFEQIQYACGKTADGGVNWDCRGKTGDIEQYGPQFGSRSWPNSGRYTLINGTVQPSITAQTGNAQRWRLIHGGVRDTIKLKIVPEKKRALTAMTTLPLDGKAMAMAQQANWITDNCDTTKPVDQFEFALDGLTRRSISQKTINVMQPGYRSDILVVFNQPGPYCVLDEQAPADDNINQQAKDRRLLAVVNVTGAAIATDPKTLLTTELAAANKDLPASVLADLKALRIPEFSPEKDIPANTPNLGHRDLNFNIDVNKTPNTFEIDGHPYDPHRIDRTLVLNTADTWDLTSSLANHPFHIHVNPFQIVDVTGTDGKSIFATGSCVDKNPDGTLDPQYCDQVGSFRDTVFVKANYHVIIRTRYLDFIGDFVLHCHILDHEDMGMMQNVSIVPSANPMMHMMR